jgi:hypothetical protein
MNKSKIEKGQPTLKQHNVIGSGMNKSQLTEKQCLGILINWNIAFESLKLH